MTRRVRASEPLLPLAWPVLRVGRGSPFLPTLEAQPEPERGGGAFREGATERSGPFDRTSHATRSKRL